MSIDRESHARSGLFHLTFLGSLDDYSFIGTTTMLLRSESNEQYVRKIRFGLCMLDFNSTLQQTSSLDLAQSTNPHTLPPADLQGSAAEYRL